MNGHNYNNKWVKGRNPQRMGLSVVGSEPVEEVEATVSAPCEPCMSCRLVSLLLQSCLYVFSLDK